jgi:hypothetical protein
MPDVVDHVIMKDVLVGTYGKTFHTWRYDQSDSSIPLGIPELVMGYTGSGQITPNFVNQRDAMFGVNTTKIRESRADIPRMLNLAHPCPVGDLVESFAKFKSLIVPAVVDGADSWKYGCVIISKSYLS